MSFHELFAPASSEIFSALGEPCRHVPSSGSPVDGFFIYDAGVQVIDEYQRIAGVRDELKVDRSVVADAKIGDHVVIWPGESKAMTVRLDALLARDEFADHWVVTRG